MGITCSICAKKQSGWIEDFPLNQNSGERVCANCYEHLNKLITTKDPVVFDIEKTYFENIICNATDIRLDTKEYVVSIIEMKSNNSLQDSHEVLKKVETEIFEKKKKQLDKQVSEMLITTGCSLDGYKIVKQIDVIFEEKIIGVGIKTNLKSIADIFSTITGDEMCAITERIKELKNIVKQQLKYQAAELGANAIIGIDFETTIPGGSCIMVSINGTAVFLENSVNTSK